MDKSKVTQKVDMFDRVIVICDSNIAIINGVPELKSSYEHYKDKVTDVKAMMKEGSTDDSGYAKEKGITWEALAIDLDIICEGLRAYANKNKNTVLAVKAQFAPSLFTKDRGTDAVQVARNLIALVQEHLPSLAGYNITQAKVTDAASLVDKLDSLNPKPIALRTTGKALRVMLHEAVKDTTALLNDEMDAMVKTLRREEPLFVQEYFNTRRLQKTGIRHEQPSSAKAPSMPLITAEDGALANTIETMNAAIPAAPMENGMAV